MAIENVRLLACQQCKTIEELPDYEGPTDRDHLLNALVERHKTNGVEHIGALFKVEKPKWDDEKVKTEVAKQITNTLSGGETGLGSAFYDLKNTFQADAYSCWTKHLRNPGCSDYKSSKMRLTPDTAAERKAAGMPTYRTADDRYLCEFCPVHSLVEQAARDKALRGK